MASIPKGADGLLTGYVVFFLVLVAPLTRTFVDTEDRFFQKV